MCSKCVSLPLSKSAQANSKLLQKHHLPRAFLTLTSCVRSADLSSYPDGNLPQSKNVQACLPSTSITPISLKIRHLHLSCVVHLSLFCLRGMACFQQTLEGGAFCPFVMVLGTCFPPLLPGLKYENIGKVTEGNHMLGNLFLLPRLINTASPLV